MRSGGLCAQEEPYPRWDDGAVLVVSEDELAELRAGGDEVNVLCLDADELLDLDFRGDRPALEAKPDRRRAAAWAAPDRVGDSPDRHLPRLLDGQGIVLRNLRDRLADEHPSAHAALLPVLDGQRDERDRRGGIAEAPAPMTGHYGEPAAVACVPDPCIEIKQQKSGTATTTVLGT